ncbi:hypothetical protein HOT82_gp093 [Gordonia phage Ronaldo]|uniref:Uncharacterized protein n=4 Tax=Ronaldovirus TaxID=2733205 RepID=A0A6B9LKT7_9CAUD|nr:hypothetical protein HOT81_gp090 [Gordonia phage Fryberger]YP_009807789.1 hypothetical protein HOT82_gp093 [Gordonia phage Ronaldo]QDH48431.1 hypothetical protein SEA_ZIKO_93 [Gordonia phage Ziko]QHB38209.1 hypothetical protein SEA_VOLT_94 [Gordonia phage Volt]QTF81879.1 hypothetical protein SEA_GUEY18_95 [Gordonia phage Guey18]AXN53507.1 hypothetical protein SEA_FRYBERGER_90 [Gordonia phage Fryberger]AXN53655.1 hypothetical protein SEA_RONALDO_93 [Gordonia phage Ronaldo]
MSEIQKRDKWSDQDLSEWVELIKKDELPYVEQLKILSFCKDLYETYSDLYQEYTRLYGLYNDARQRLQKLADPVARMIWVILHDDKMTDEEKERAIIYWAQQVELDFLG